MSNEPSIRVLELRQAGPVLVCRKCLKRMVNGGKLRKRLRIGLKQHGAGRKKHRARLGLAAIDVTRPLPFTALPRPALADLARDLLRKRDGDE